MIDNALKFKHPERDLKLIIQGEELEQAYQFSIMDNGRGIDSRYFENIFILFKRLNDRSIKGSGVDLAICKKIIEMQSRQINVVSKEGEGTTFSFTIPKKLMFKQ